MGPDRYPVFGARLLPARRALTAARLSLQKSMTSADSLARLEWTVLALLSKGASSLVEILTQIELQRLRLHVDLAGELLQVPAPGADGSAHAQWRILVDLVSQRTGHVEIG